MTIAKYIRLNKNDNYQLELQKCELDNYIKKNYKDANILEYVDYGLNINSDIKQGIKKLTEEVQKGNIDVVLTTNYNRFSKDINICCKIMNDILLNNVKIIAIDSLETTDEIFTIMNLQEKLLK